MTVISRTATAAAICAAVLLTGTACTSDNGPKTSAKKSAPATPTASAQPTADANAVQHVDGETVTAAPKLEGKKTIASFANGRFSRRIPLDGGLRKGTLGIALNCEGKGTVRVEVAALGLSFSERCVDGEVASVYNEDEVSSVYPDASLHVISGSGVRWAVSAGL